MYSSINIYGTISPMPPVADLSMTVPHLGPGIVDKIKEVICGIYDR